MKYKEIMVDIETTGTTPDHNAMIQLSAVRFNLETRSVDLNMFDECLLIPGNRYWSEDTRDWWAGLEPHILNGIWGRMRPVAEVLREFLAWSQRDLDGEMPILWAKPTHFEYPFLQSYFREYGVAMPFHYSEAQDLRSWCRARGMSNLDRDLPFEGDAHNAIQDVLHQIKTLFTLMEKTDAHAV